MLEKFFSYHIKNAVAKGGISLILKLNYLLSQDWFATPQLVLQADWHDV